MVTTRTAVLAHIGVALTLISMGSACAEPEPIDEALVLPYVHAGVPWVFDDDGYQYLIDTGTPRTFVVPAVIDEAPDTFRLGVLPRWDVLGLGAGSEVVVTYELPPPIMPMIGPEFGGILGADILGAQAFVLDPYRGRFILDPDGQLDEWMQGTDWIVELPAQVVGGGSACMSEGHCFDHSRSRMLVEVLVNDEPVIALVDTASTYTTLGLGLATRIGLETDTTTVDRGIDTWDFIRLDALDLGDARLAGVPVRLNPMIDTGLARLSVETNRDVELLLGHSVLLHFAAGVDYPGQRLVLGHYRYERPLETEIFVGFGLWLADTLDRSGCFRVSALVLGSEADESGVEVGSCVTALEGQPAQELGFDEAEFALAGAGIGETIEFEIRAPHDDPKGVATSVKIVSLTKRDFLPR